MSKERQQDRIMHLLLSEGLARQSPPDLSQRIFAPAFPEPSIATLATLEPEDYSLPLPRISTLPTPKPVAVEPDELDEPAVPQKPARRPLIFRLARPLVAAAMLALVVGILMYVNRPYPQPALAGDFTITGGGPVARGAEVVTSQKTARLTLGGLYQLELAPATRLTINGAPHAEAVTLQDGQVTADIANDLGDMLIKTEAGTITASDARFRATLESESVSSGKGETNMMIHKKLLVAVFSGIVTVSGNWGQTSFAAGHEQAFTASGAVSAPNAIATTPPTNTAATRIAGTIASVSADAVSVQVSGGTTVSVSITPNTTVKISDHAAALADLKTGMNVVIYITNTTTQIIASVPAAPKPPAPPATTNITGTIAAIADGQITIKSSTHTTVVTVTDSTIVKIKDAAATLADLKTGMSILAITTDGKTATEIHAYIPNTPPTPTPTPTPPAITTVGGTVSQVGNGQVTITDGAKNTVLTFTNTTTFNVNNVAANADALKTGMHIYATTTDGKTATTVRAYTPTTPPTPTPTPPATTTIGGTLSLIASGQVTITDGTKNTVLTLTNTTTINVNGAAATADALKTGMHIYATTTDGKTATTIRATSPTPTPTPTPTPPATTTLTGTISQISATQIGIQSSTKTTIIGLSSATIFKLNGNVVGRGDIKTGMSVAVLTADGKVATEVRAYSTSTTTPPAALTVNGVVSQIAPNQITIQDGTKITVVTFTDGTTFTINSAASGPTALKVGMHISASVTDGKVAKTIQAYTPSTTTNTK